MRRKATREGYGIHKSRRYVDGWDNQGEYMLIDARQNLCVLACRRTRGPPSAAADLPPVVDMPGFPGANEPCRKHAFAITLGYLTT